MNIIKEYKQTIFESIKHIDEFGNEYWEARELQKVLEYKEWRNFNKVLQRAMVSCNISKIDVNDHFVELNKMINLAKGAERKVRDYKLSRYACYLIVQNGDPSKEVIALGQTYFAIETRKQEITEEEYDLLSEDEKRLYTRITVNNKNKKLFYTARKAGVRNFAKFNNYGYMGLYNGETAKDIKKRKKLKENEDILDWMGSTELAANLFRITQTEDVIDKKKIKGEQASCDTHYKVGKAVRGVIEEIGGTMPEDLPTPKTSVKEIENKIKRDLVNKK